MCCVICIWFVWSVFYKVFGLFFERILIIGKVKRVYMVVVKSMDFFRVILKVLKLFIVLNIIEFYGCCLLGF